MDINKEIEMLESEFVEIMDSWTGLEDVIIKATNQAMVTMEEDNDEDFMLKAHAISVFVSRIQYILHEKLKAIEIKIKKLEEKKDARDILIPVGK